MEYQGTDKDDILDQIILKLPDGSTIYGRAGNDHITIAWAIAVGGPGNDSITGSSPISTIAYYDSPSGIVADLSKGTVADGFGTVDTVSGIHNVQGSSHDDIFIAGSGNDRFYGGWGNDRYVGGAGTAAVDYYFVKSTDARVTYDAASDIFTVFKNFPSGDHGTDTLTGIASVNFGSDGVVFTKNNFVGKFIALPHGVQTVLPSGTNIAQLKTGDFNGDGNADYALNLIIGTGTAPAPTLVYLGDGKGGFIDGTASVFAAGSALAVAGGGRTLVGDFNRDGITDIFQLDFGDDAPPFPTGLNKLYLSNAGTHQLVNASDSLHLPSALNHGGAVGDVNGDGYLDILVNTLDRGNVLLINDRTGHFTDQSALIPHPTVFAFNTTQAQTNTYSGIIDVNNDGHADIILGKWDNVTSTPTSQVLLNDGTGNFTKTAPIALPQSAVGDDVVLDVRPIDLNGDQLPDLMLSITNGGDRAHFYQVPYIQLLVNDGGGHFHDETAVRLPQNAAYRNAQGSAEWFNSLTPVDFNHDGHPDILANGAGGPAHSIVYLNQGDGTFKEAWRSAEGFHAVALDVDRNGMADVVSVASTGSADVGLNQFIDQHVYNAASGGGSGSGVGDDTIKGSSGSDRMLGISGHEVIDGGDSLDTLIMLGKAADYSTVKTATGFQLTELAHPLNTASLANIERIVFADSALGLDINGTGGEAYRLYQAAFARQPDQAGLGFQINALDTGFSLSAVAKNFIDSPEFARTYGGLDDKQFVTQLYANVLHRVPDSAGLAFHVGHLATGLLARQDILAQFSESPENQVNVIGSIQNGIPFLVHG